MATTEEAVAKAGAREARNDSSPRSQRARSWPRGPAPNREAMTVTTALAMDCVDHLWVPILVADKIERCMFCTTVRVWQVVEDRTEWVYYRHRREAA